MSVAFRLPVVNVVAMETPLSFNTHAPFVDTLRLSLNIIDLFLVIGVLIANRRVKLHVTRFHSYCSS